jgi:hypothetical protein
MLLFVCVILSNWWQKDIVPMVLDLGLQAVDGTQHSHTIGLELMSVLVEK